MQVEIMIDAKYKEPKLVIMADSVSEEVNEILKKIAESTPKVITGFQEDLVKIIEPASIYRIYANDGKVYVETTEGEYTVRLRLYEIEERLSMTSFVRISNSEIVNLEKVKNFDLSFTGTICVTLINGTVTYVSRRYVSKIKKVLGI